MKGTPEAESDTDQDANEGSTNWVLFKLPKFPVAAYERSYGTVRQAAG